MAVSWGDWGSAYTALGGSFRVVIDHREGAGMFSGKRFKVTWAPVVGRPWRTTRVLTLKKWSETVLIFGDSSGRRVPVPAAAVTKIRRAR